MFKDAVLRWALFIAIMMMLSQQLSGINAVINYFIRLMLSLQQNPLFFRLCFIPRKFSKMTRN